MARAKNPVFPIPRTKIPQDNLLHIVIDEVEKQAFRYRLYNYENTNQINPADAQELCLIQNACRLFIVHYLIRKKFNTRHKMPNLSKTEKPVIYSLGDVYYRAFNLTAECFVAGTTEAQQYRHPTIWWGYILDELVIHKFYDRTINPDCKKNEFISRIQSDNKKLTDYENIFDPDTTPHTWSLIKSSINLAEQSDVFRRQTWRPFLKARRDAVKAEKENPSSIFLRLEEGRILGVKPRTKGKVIVPISESLNVPRETFTWQ